jgi:malonate-semialdehyde dehydrogenase (acetylating)/methylmalonate-semialdehyde dehydrogenase
MAADRLKNYIAGEWRDSKTTQYLDVLNPTTNRAIAQVPLSTAADVEDAIAAANDAFNEWRETPPTMRVQYLFRLKELMEAHFEDVARTIVTENGKTLDEARGETRRTIENIEVATGVTSLMMGRNLEDVARGIDEEVVRQPMGAFAVIAPYNFPAMVPWWFAPYAMATGNTYIVKPSEQAPLTQSAIFDLVHDLDLPPGVMNLVHGGREVVDVLTKSPGIVGISSVTSTPVAKAIYTAATGSGKRAQCQAGAKNFIVVMPDADIEKAIPGLLASCYGCAGQRCLAGAVLVPVGEAYEPLRDRFVKAAAKIKVGDPLDESAQMGPVISKQHQQRVLRHIEQGVKDGAKLLLDGRQVTVPGCEEGYFVGPTVLDGVTPEMAIARDEIFGPVIGILRVGSLDEAIEVIDANPYGNASSIFTASGGAAREFKYRVKCGNIGVNVGVAAPMAFFPFGGRKDSFFGDLHGQGQDAIDFLTEKKVVITRW